MVTTTQPTETVEQRLAALEREFVELRAQVLGLKPREKDWRRTVGTMPATKFPAARRSLAASGASRRTTNNSVLVLDTDHASELGMRSAAGVRLLNRLALAKDEAVITAITVEEQMRGWLAEIRRHTDPARQNGTFVLIEFFYFRHYPEDADDIAFLLCALNGDATHLVTYDTHLHLLQPHFALAICEPLHFLADLRSA